MTAATIIELLAERHAGDVFVPECKAGPTWTDEHLRMDAWAMRKSWSRPCVWAYEVKVSRGDWLKDGKWHAYLPMCNELCIVCPSGVVRPDELPSEAGLIYVSENGARLFTKKKAPHRQVTVPDELYRYLLMNRVQISEKEKPEPPRAERIESWRTWLAERDAAKELGMRIAAGTREYVNRIETENALLKRDNEALALFKQRLSELGVDVSRGVWDWEVQSALRKVAGEIPHCLESSLDGMEQAIHSLRKSIREAEKHIKAPAALESA